MNNRTALTVRGGATAAVDAAHGPASRLHCVFARQAHRSLLTVAAGRAQVYVSPGPDAGVVELVGLGASAPGGAEGAVATLHVWTLKTANGNDDPRGRPPRARHDDRRSGEA